MIKKTKTPKMTKKEELEKIEKRRDELYDILEKKDKLWDFSKSYDKYQSYRHLEETELSKLDTRRRMIIDPVYEDIPDYGDVMNINDFIDTVNSGGFIDYDGYGHYVADGFIIDGVETSKMSNIEIYPSDIKKGNIRPGFNKIIWFNR